MRSFGRFSSRPMEVGFVAAGGDPRRTELGSSVREPWCSQSKTVELLSFARRAVAEAAEVVAEVAAASAWWTAAA